MNRKDELYHYGVKGMKWGKRKPKLSKYKKGVDGNPRDYLLNQRDNPNNPLHKNEPRVYRNPDGSIGAATRQGLHDAGRRYENSERAKQARSDYAREERRKQNKKNYKIQRSTTGYPGAASFIRKLRYDTVAKKKKTKSKWKFS